MDGEHHRHHHQVPDTTAGDFRHFFSARPMFPAAAQFPPPPPPPHNHQSLLSPEVGGAFTPLLFPQPHPYESTMLFMGGAGGRGPVPDHVHHSVDFNSDSTTTTTSATAPAAAMTTMPSAMGLDGDGAGGSTARWPRQETLTLLEVRSRLDHKFKEANHKGPLWDQVSRIMCDEYGYQRSGKKCREKFENLYKYYKKTKGGKGGRQDGKNYRFFRQLDVLYGDTSTTNATSNPLHQLASTSDTPADNISLYDHHREAKPHSFSLTNSSSELHTSSSEDQVKRRGKRDWKSKIKGFIDLQMRNMMERQESWLEKMTTTLEYKEKERMLRDEEWRSQASHRMEREHMLWVEERAWIEARDRALINTLQKVTNKELLVEEKELSSSHHSNQELHQREIKEGDDQERWLESEITDLIRLRSSMDLRFEHCGVPDLDQISLWEEIASRMASMGYERKNGRLCKKKWDHINSLVMKNHTKMNEIWRIESVDCSTSSHHQNGQGNHPYSCGGGGGRNPMTDSFNFFHGNE